MQTKRCTKCGRELPLSEFSRLKTGKNGLRPICNECNRAIVKAWYVVHREERKEYTRRYNTTKKERLKTLAAREREQRQEEFKKNILAGWKMYVLNYAAQRERKFNAVSTAGDVFRTNDKREFLAYLEKVL